MSTCLRCGRCCSYLLNGKVKKCKYLVKLSGGKTICRVYKNRLGKVIDKDKENDELVVCTERSVSPYDYKACPYNTDKPLFGEIGDMR